MPARMTRNEGRALTRERLLRTAQELFRQAGYAATSLERIAETAGYSKGAIYSNFQGKEDIFLEVLDAQGQDGLVDVVEYIGRASDDASVVDCLARWADLRSRSGYWALTILEHARLGQANDPSVQRQASIIRSHWRQLGSALLSRYPNLGGEAETIGALLYEIAYAPALTLMAKPTAGDLMRLTMTALLTRRE